MLPESLDVATAEGEGEETREREREQPALVSGVIVNPREEREREEASIREHSEFTQFFLLPSPHPHSLWLPSLATGVSLSTRKP